ncbi:porin [Kordiimonas laminariae]|uniref:porin n=1 Tax=Kordiimonas laminariae TaxID=2917717 RepID=UPI001FF49748|nr:porin [Kordiimonas laminariae]MCK0071117.1 OprO/OprP family phosphate-selective porin [Kordiimonas laminariae]
MKALSYWGVAVSLMTTVSAVALTPPTFAQDANPEVLAEKLKLLELEIEKLKQQLQKTEQKAEKGEKIAKKANSKVAYLEEKSETIRPSSWHLAGYADVGIEVSNGENSDTFTSGKFNPAFHFQYKDLILFESELEISTSNTGETEIDVEYSQLDFLLHDNAVLVAGKFLSPVGQFQERLHPSWINRAVNAPAGFGHGGIQPLSEVGLMLRGGVPIGNKLFTYSVAIGNGPRTGHDGVELEGFGRDDNSNKGLSGRFAFFPVDEFEIGASFLTAKVLEEDADGESLIAASIEGGSEDPTNSTSRPYNLWGADFAYTRGNWDIRGEYLNAKLERDGPNNASVSEPINDLKWEAWYAQAAYRLSGLTNSTFIDKLEPVVRYGRFTAEGDHEMEDELSEKRFNLGLNYWATPSVVVKTGLEFRSYLAEHREDDTRLQLLMSYGF